MKRLKENKPLRYILAVVVFILLCCNLPSLALCFAQNVFRPPNTEVLVSACKRPIVRGVPGGEVVLVHENLTDKTYLLDLRTGEKRKVPDDPLLLSKGIFLSSELVWLEGSLVGPENPSYRPHYILDLTNGQRYELVDLKWQFPNKLLDNGDLNPDLFLYFTESEHVYIHHTENRLIALAPNFRQNPDKNVIFPQTSFGPVSLGANNGELLEELMKDLGVDYEIVDFSLDYADIPSPTGKYVVRKENIYVSNTNLEIDTDGAFVNIKSWYYDETGVVVQANYKYLFSSPLGPQFLLIPSPILKLNLPIE
jgi:hypothetical protein